jgi:uncharacterized protein YndB with AHSA1/START domain
VIQDVLYMTNVRVAEREAARWDPFYDEWTRVFTEIVPGCSRGSRWRVVSGVSQREDMPVSGWPAFQAIFEHPRLDAFILSRNYRGLPEWQPRAHMFDPWFRSLRDYATLHLHKLATSDGRGPLPPALLSTIWTIAEADLEGFERWYDAEVAGGFARVLGAGSVHRYFATLAHVHRYGDENGKLIIPQRHHFEDGGRLCYVTLFELARVPEPAAQRRALDDLGSLLARWEGVIADRQEAFVERQLVIESDADKPWTASGTGAPEGAAPAHPELRTTIEIAAPPARVWRAFATEDAWRGWFDPGVRADVRPGGAFAVGGGAARLPAAPFAGAIAELDEPRRVSVRWYTDAARYRDPVSLTFELEPAGSGTRVVLQHLGWEQLEDPRRTAQLRALRDALDALRRYAQA